MKTSLNSYNETFNLEFKTLVDTIFLTTWNYGIVKLRNYFVAFATDNSWFCKSVHDYLFRSFHKLYMTITYKKILSFHKKGIFEFEIASVSLNSFKVAIG